MATPTVSPGAQTSEFSITKLLAWAGLLMIIVGAVVQVLFSEQKDLGAQLIKYGSALMGTVGVAYTAFRSGVKIFALAKSYEPMANAAVALLPGPVGDEARHFLPVIEKLVDALAATGDAAPAPAPASVAVAAAVSTPVAPAASPAAPSAA